MAPELAAMVLDAVSAMLSDDTVRVDVAVGMDHAVNWKTGTFEAVPNMTRTLTIRVNGGAIDTHADPIGFFNGRPEEDAR